jgi:transcriptional regulator with XRE-family HTH domain
LVDNDLTEGELRRRKALGAVIRKRRQAMRWTQPEFAKAIQKAPQQVHRYESGKSAISIDMLDVIASALGVPAQDLFAEALEEEKKNPTGKNPLQREYQPGPVPGLRQLATREGFKIYSLSPLKRLPPRAYAVVYDYLNKLEAAGYDPEEIEWAEEFLANTAFNKLNSREPRERSEEEIITDLKAGWEFLRGAAARNGRKL